MSTTYKDNQRGHFARLWLVGLMALLTLAGCGGGGGNTGGGFTAPDPVQVSINTSSTTAPVNFLERLPALNSPFTVQLNVRVVTGNGSPVQDGTIVNMTTDNVDAVTVSTLDDPDTNDIDEFRGRFGQISTTTSGGNATFFYTTAGETGTATLTASAADTFSNSTSTAAIQVTVVPTTADSRLTLEATRTTLPANVNNVPPFIGSPYISEVTIRYRDVDGEFAQPLNGEFGVAIAPVFNGAFSTLDDPDTDDVNEFVVLVGNGPVSSAGGQGTVFIHSFDGPGTVTLTVTATDPGGQQFSEQLDVTIVAEAANGLPATIALNNTSPAVYIQGSGGNTSAIINAEVLDGGAQSVPDPVAGANRFNNVRLTLTQPGNAALLVGTNASGSNVSGTEIDVATTNGVIQAALNSGNTVGVHRVTAVADRADNNVDNGIQDPITSQLDVVVGDGRLSGLEIASPLINAIRINRVIDDEFLDIEELFPDEMGEIPPDPDATYRLTVSVTVTDSVGNPVLPGNAIQLGKVDEPLDSDDINLFAFSGVDGNPVEGGNLFTTPTTDDGFLDDPTIVDEAVNLGDFLLTLGDLIPGNRELESVRVVSGVATDNILNVSQSFNNNDPSGVIVDDGPVIPYVIGRSIIGNLPGQLVIEEDGVGEFFLTYPTSAVGRPLALWAQGNRDDNGTTQTVADIELLVFPGIGPANISITPGSIPGNTTVPITVCVTDRLLVPLRGVDLTFTTDGQGSFSVSDDPLVTGLDGCVTTDATSSGLSLDQDPLRVIFSGAGSTGTLLVIPPDTAFISVSPNSILLTAASPRTVTVTVVDENGAPIPSTTVNAMCDATATVNPASGTTDASGEADFTISTTEMPMMTQVTGSCVFSVDTANGTIEATLIYTVPVIPPSP